jgi:hypothetical protein
VAIGWGMDSTFAAILHSDPRMPQYRTYADTKKSSPANNESGCEAALPATIVRFFVGSQAHVKVAPNRMRRIVNNKMKTTGREHECN